MIGASIILVNYNGFQDTIECIESLWKMSTEDFRVIIVENGSTDNSHQQLSQFVNIYHGSAISSEEVDNTEYIESRLILVSSPFNGGFAYGNNIGIRLAVRLADTKYIWLLNNDTIVHEDALAELIKAHQEKSSSGEKKPGIIGSKILFYHNRSLIQGIGGTFTPLTAKTRLIGFNKVDHGQYDYYDGNLDMILGASMFVDTDFITTVGYLNEDYFLYFEELDWSKRALRFGYTTSCHTPSIVYHKQGASTNNRVFGKKNNSAMVYMYSSLILFYKTFYPKYLILAKIRILLQLIKYRLQGRISMRPLFSKIFLNQ
ncbi:MAG: glycosyltransferase family 2 protein [Cytophagia bacterium]|nr:glycosyltransferase family 2 protein [Cytophagia bacterium]